MLLTIDWNLFISDQNKSLLFYVVFSGIWSQTINWLNTGSHKNIKELAGEISQSRWPKNCPLGLTSHQHYSGDQDLITKNSWGTSQTSPKPQPLLSLGHNFPQLWTHCLCSILVKKICYEPAEIQPLLQNRALESNLRNQLSSPPISPVWWFTVTIVEMGEVQNRTQGFFSRSGLGFGVMNWGKFLLSVVKHNHPGSVVYFWWETDPQHQWLEQG